MEVLTLKYLPPFTLSNLGRPTNHLIKCEHTAPLEGQDDGVAGGRGRVAGGKGKKSNQKVNGMGMSVCYENHLSLKVPSRKIFPP